MVCIYITTAIVTAEVLAVKVTLELIIELITELKVQVEIQQLKVFKVFNSLKLSIVVTTEVLIKLISGTEFV